jgi:hypothetical protein
MTELSRLSLRYVAMALAGVALFGYATGVLMAPAAAAFGDRLGELTCLQVAFTAERVAAVLRPFSAEQVGAIAGLLRPGDMVFAWGYGLLLTGLLGLLTLRLPDDWQRAGRWLLWAPLVASLFDCSEDYFLHQLVTAPAGADPGGAPLLAGLSATAKYLLLSGVAPAYGIAGTIKGLTVDRRTGALLVYALVVVNAVAFVAKPLQQVPPCF